MEAVGKIVVSFLVAKRFIVNRLFSKLQFAKGKFPGLAQNDSLALEVHYDRVQA